MCVIATMALTLAALVGAASASASLYVSGEESQSPANQPRFKATEYPVSVSGEQPSSNKRIFTDSVGNTAECESVDLQTNATESVSSLVVEAEYDECTAWGLEASVDMDGCFYSLSLANADPYETGGIEAYRGDVELICFPNGGLEITVDLCTATINPFVGAEEAAFGNYGSGPDRVVLAEADVDGLEHTYSGYFCPRQVGTYTDGSLRLWSIMSGLH